MRKTNTIAALLLAAIAAGLAGCGDKAAEEAAACKKAEEEAAKVVMKQGNGKVRKWGESGFVDVRKPATPVSSPAALSNEKGK
ncbi:hypothetical protein [Laribacter hongkongensis]|uniref:Lipoprotein n=1 Tax=Laribacter hongkongensis TaxID=168471 RepID=A0ABD4SPL4_9NEIS|nr:hypothetical protein [Laribacter hongkongensis]MCG9024496.1 hypothetical protein [Laribacter hongkongensis]